MKMTSYLLATVTALAVTASPLAAQVLIPDGEVSNFTNDYFGDGHDRWHSGSYQKSYFFDEITGSQLFKKLELRGRTQIVTPWKGDVVAGEDRPYSSAIALGAFVHGSAGILETRAGGEFIISGDQTGLPNLQAFAHDSLGMSGSYNPLTRDDPHLDDAFGFRGEAEVAFKSQMSETFMMRPFAEQTFGVDQASTVGVDVVWGTLSANEVWTRDAVTGQLLSASKRNADLFTLVAGVDYSNVSKSMHFEEGSYAELQNEQYRVRVGSITRIHNMTLFFGQTWLSEQFVGQPEVQRVGSMAIDWVF